MLAEAPRDIVEPASADSTTLVDLCLPPYIRATLSIYVYIYIYIFMWVTGRSAVCAIVILKVIFLVTPITCKSTTEHYNGKCHAQSFI